MEDAQVSPPQHTCPASQVLDVVQVPELQVRSMHIAGSPAPQATPFGLDA